MNNKQTDNSLNSEINLHQIVKRIWEKKKFLLCFTLLSFLFSIAFSLTLPNKYISSTLLAPTNQDDSLSSKLGQYSGIVGLAGLNLPSDSNTKSQEAIERIMSFNFFKSYFLPNIKLQNLMAVTQWDSSKNELIYDDNLFDVATNSWVRKASKTKNIIPSAQEAYEEVYKDIIILNVDKNTGFVSISIKHESPIIAKKWLDLIVYNINESMREIDKVNAQNSITFLNELANSTNVQSIKEAISNLLETQMQTLMLASSNQSYIFKTIDPPIAPEKKSGPNRILISISGLFIGLLISIFIIVIGHINNLLKFNL